MLHPLVNVDRHDKLRTLFRFIVTKEYVAIINLEIVLQELYATSFHRRAFRKAIKIQPCYERNNSATSGSSIPQWCHFKQGWILLFVL